MIDRDLGPLKMLSEELNLAGARCAIRVADVRSRGDLHEAIGALADELGPIDILIASAGVCGISTVDALDVDQVHSIVATNLLGVIYAIECVLPSMLRRKGGQIVGIASLAAVCGVPFEWAYGASKAGLAMYLEGLRPSLKRENIAVTTIFPGFVRTRLLEALLGSTSARPPFDAIRTESAAQRIVRAIAGRHRVSYFPWRTALLAHGSRLLPAILRDWVMDNIACRMLWGCSAAANPVGLLRDGKRHESSPQSGLLGNESVREPGGETSSLA